MLQEKVKILQHHQVNGPYYAMRLSCGRDYADAVPGQFIMLRLPGQVRPLLSRPFSIHRLIRQQGSVQAIEILYKVVGDCTKAFSACKKGDFVELRGPLGNGFSVLEKFHSVYIVAGGIGVAPMVFLANYMKEKGLDLSSSRMFLGGRTKDDILCRDDFNHLNIAQTITTDDGSDGFHGLVTEPLEKTIQNDRPDMIFACGPSPMLKSVAGIAETYGIPCQVSIETLMACGIGVCLGCAVNHKTDSSQTYRHVCIDGPVFDATTLNL